MTNLGMNKDIPSVGLSLIILSFPKQYMLIMKKASKRTFKIFMFTFSQIWGIL